MDLRLPFSSRRVSISPAIDEDTAPTVPLPEQIPLPKPSPATWEAFANTVLGETRAYLQKVVASDNPIVVGPWVGEVGFELLYWIPFLRWVKRKYSLPAERLVAVSRGGPKSWYADITPNYFDVFDTLSVQDYQRRNQERIEENGGGQKQVIVSRFETQLAAMAREAQGWGKAELLHPSLMYNLFTHFWKQRAPMRFVESLSSYALHGPVPRLDGLPSDYIAAKFYFSLPFPNSPENGKFVAAVLRNLTQQMPVVLLNTGLSIDDHPELAGLGGEHVITLDGKMTPADNLEVQTRVVAGARAFVGTYGGFSYLAPLQGVHSYAFYSDDARHERHHLELAHKVFSAVKGGELAALSVRQAQSVATLILPPRIPTALNAHQAETSAGLAVLPEPPAHTVWDADTTKRLASTRAKLVALAKSGKPIVVGPWLGEVGFELLYWVPFVRWAVEELGLPPERMVALSRGGVASWYQGLAGRYLEVFDFMTPDEFRIKNDDRTGPLGGLKQSKTLSPMETEIIDRAKAAIGARDVELLHPSLMYGATRPYYKSQVGLDYLDAITRYRAMPHPRLTGLEWLPKDYVAVKFYFSPNFPDTQLNRNFIRRTLQRLTAQSEVVLLTTGLKVDDHSELDSVPADRCHTIDALVTPANNLEVQSHVISGARAFVGTYGGLSYLPPFYGVDSLAFYSDAGPFNPRHLALAKYVSQQPGRGSLTMMATADYEAAERVLFASGTAQ